MVPAKQTPSENSEFKDIQISHYKNCTATICTALNLDSLFAPIRSGEGLKPLIEKLRTTDNPTEKEKLKQQLPAVTVSGLFGKARTKENLLAYSGLMQVDFDKVEYLTETRAKLEKDKFSFAVFLSPSGNGIKLIVRVSNDYRNHSHSFLALEKYYLETYNLQLDKSCKDINRLMFLSWDKDLFTNEKAIVFYPEKDFEEKEFESALAYLNKTEAFKQGNRHRYILILASLCSQRKISEAFTEKKCLDNYLQTDFSEKEIKDIIKDAFNNPANAPKNKILTGERKPEKHFSKIKQVEDYINSKYEVRNNVVSCKIESRGKSVNEDFAEFNEHDIFRDISHKNLDYSLNKLKSLMNSNFVPVFNPFQNYFESLKKWDSATEIDFIEKLASYVPTKDNERFKRHLKKMLVRSIACALIDTVFNKQAFILVHDQQNSGKSTFCRWLCPPALSDYIAENINTDKDSQIALATNFFINMDELATLSKVEINALKSFLSKDKVNVRLPYDSRTTIRPRRANFIGSTNKDEFLNDETGSVRWLCFELTDKINFAYKTEIDVNDIWRQAYTLFLQDFEYLLTPDEISENETVNKQFLINTPEMDLIPKYFKPGTKDKHDLFLTATAIQSEIAVGNPHINLTAHAIGKALKILSFVRGTEYNESTKQSVKGYYVFKA